MTACQRERCDHKGEWYVVLRVPPMGGPIAQALQLVVGLELCRDHCDEIDPVDYLTPESKNRIKIELMKLGRAMPDFARAEISRGKIGDDRWRQFQAIRQGPT